MSKTSLDPAVVGQLKKLFVENVTDKNILLAYGTVKLAGGSFIVTLPFNHINIQVTGPGSSIPTRYYAVDKSIGRNQFKIWSSFATDDALVDWIALGG